jgi:hypothetical protein
MSTKVINPPILCLLVSLSSSSPGFLLVAIAAAVSIGTDAAAGPYSPGRLHWELLLLLRPLAAALPRVQVRLPLSLPLRSRRLPLLD